MRAPHVLVAEPDREVGTVLALILAENGFSVSLAGTAAELETALGGGSVDALLLDTDLPLAAYPIAARWVGRGLKLVMMSADLDAPERLETLPYPYVVKPCRMDALVGVVREALRGVSAAPAPTTKRALRAADG
jgi:DNA-binding response OmpR family regulator